MAKGGLTPKQQDFVTEYLASLNATEAYRKVYDVDQESAEASGPRLLGNVRVARAIALGRKDQQERLRINADEVLDELRVLAHSDISDILDFSGEQPKFKRACDIPPNARRCISGIKVRRYVEGKGAEAREVEVVEFKLWSKPDAVRGAMQHLGLLKDSVEITFPAGVPTTPEDADAGRRRTLAYREARLKNGEPDQDQRNGTG